MNHITVGVYKNGDYKINVVREEHLEDHILYNTTMRFGRALFVDGKCIYDGYLTPSECDAWEAKMPEITKDVNINKASEKYY